MKHELVIVGADGIKRSMVVACAGSVKRIAVVGENEPGAPCCGPGCLCQPHCGGQGSPLSYCQLSEGRWSSVPLGGGAHQLITTYIQQPVFYDRCCKTNVQGAGLPEERTKQYHRLIFKYGANTTCPGSWTKQERWEEYDGLGGLMKVRERNEGSGGGGFGCPGAFVSDQTFFESAVPPYRPAGCRHVACTAEVGINVGWRFGRPLTEEIPFLNGSRDVVGYWKHGDGFAYGNAEFKFSDPSSDTTVLQAWHAYVEPALPAPCFTPGCRRACCVPGADCREDLTAEQCAAIGGHPLPIGSACYGANCEIFEPRVRGACCDPASGFCNVVSPISCRAPKVYLGNGTTCGFGSCPSPQGACCHGSGNAQCSITSQILCAQMNGAWRGPFTTCAGNPCSQPGACCLNDGSGGCVNTTSENCLSLGGTFSGPSTDCSTTPCTGACCCQTSHGWDCGQTTAAGCPSVAGGCVFFGLGSSCDPSPCGAPPPIQNPGISLSGKGLYVPSRAIIVPHRSIVSVSGAPPLTGGCSGCGKEVGGF